MKSSHSDIGLLQSANKMQERESAPAANVIPFHTWRRCVSLTLMCNMIPMKWDCCERNLTFPLALESNKQVFTPIFQLTKTVESALPVRALQFISLGDTYLLLPFDFPSLLWLQSFLGLGQHNSNLWLHIRFSSCCVCLFFFSLIKKLVIGFRAHPNLGWSHLEIIN